MTDLSGKTALVTGSVQGIGLAIARALAEAGARIAVHGLSSAEEAEAALAELREAGAPDVRFFDADMRDPDAIEAMMDAVADWGDPDILVNNAGIQKTVSLAEADRDTWDAILSVNLSGAFHTMRRALPGMAERGYGRVVNIASVHGQVASANKAAYVTAKHGLVGLTKTVALETATDPITCNAICPGWVRTPLVEAQIEARAKESGRSIEEEAVELVREKQPSLGFVSTGDIGGMVGFLCSDAANQMTGTTLTIDGGWTAQ